MKMGIGRMIEGDCLAALREAHERHVPGWLGPTWLWLDVGDDGRVASIVAETSHDAPGLVPELRAVLEGFEVPDMGVPRRGRIFLSCGFRKQPRNPTGAWLDGGQS